MKITTSLKQDTALLTLYGRLDYSARHTFREAIQVAYEYQQSTLVLDLEAVTFIDSTGLGLIYQCIKEVANKNMNASIINPKPQIHDFLSLCNMDQYIASPFIISSQ